MCRYQQFRAVNKAIERLQTGKTRQQDGEHDRRGGVIWHTQGSGKSLTMVFLVRKLRTNSQLRRFKVIVITDRKDLQKQLSDTAALTGEVVQVASSIDSVKRLVGNKGPALLFAAIQKYRDPDTTNEAENDDELDAAIKLATSPVNPQKYEVINDDDSILVLIDEAHRSHTKDSHAYLMGGIPNAA